MAARAAERVDNSPVPFFSDSSPLSPPASPPPVPPMQLSGCLIQKPSPTRNVARDLLARLEGKETEGKKQCKAFEARPIAPGKPLPLLTLRTDDSDSDESFIGAASTASVASTNLVATFTLRSPQPRAYPVCTTPPPIVLEKSTVDLLGISEGDSKAVNAVLQEYKLCFADIPESTLKNFDKIGRSILAIDLLGCTIDDGDCSRYFPCASAITLRMCTFTARTPDSLFTRWAPTATELVLASSTGVDLILGKITALKNLKKLDLSCCKKPLDDNGAAALAKLTTLTELRISQNNCTSTTLHTLAPLVQLRLLDISQTKIKDLTAIAHFAHLEELHLRRNAGVLEPENNLLHLLGLKALKVLDLQNNDTLTDAHLLQLSKLPNLVTLDVRGCSLLTEAGRAAFCKAAPKVALTTS